MNKQSLSQTNPYLRNQKRRLAALITTVSSSSAIEGIAARDLLGKYISKGAAGSNPQHPAENDQSQS